MIDIELIHPTKVFDYIKTLDLKYFNNDIFCKKVLNQVSVIDIVDVYKLIHHRIPYFNFVLNRCFDYLDFEFVVLDAPEKLLEHKELVTSRFKSSNDERFLLLFELFSKQTLDEQLFAFFHLPFPSEHLINYFSKFKNFNVYLQRSSAPIVFCVKDDIKKYFKSNLSDELKAYALARASDFDVDTLGDFSSDIEREIRALRQVRYLDDVAQDRIKMFEKKTHRNELDIVPSDLVFTLFERIPFPSLTEKEIAYSRIEKEQFTDIAYSSSFDVNDFVKYVFKIDVIKFVINYFSQLLKKEHFEVLLKKTRDDFNIQSKIISILQIQNVNLNDISDFPNLVKNFWIPDQNMRENIVLICENSQILHLFPDILNGVISTSDAYNLVKHALIRVDDNNARKFILQQYSHRYRNAAHIIKTMFPM